MIKLRPKHLCLVDYLVQGHQLLLLVPAQVTMDYLLRGHQLSLLVPAQVIIVRIQQLDYVQVRLAI